MSATHVVSLGSINVDLTVQAGRWPEPGETLIGERFRMLGGGKAANVAVVAARLGHTARLVGRVGDDPFGDWALAPVRAAGVDVSAVRTAIGHTTGLATIVVRDDGEKTIVLAENANQRWTPADLRSACAAVDGAPAGSVLVCDLEVSHQVVEAAAEIARERGLDVVLDPSPAGRVTDRLLQLADAVTPNPAEARRLTGIEVRSPDDAAAAGERLCARGVAVACMKLPGGGCVIVSAGRPRHVPAPAVDVVDATGAGDAFAGGLAVGRLEGRAWPDAARIAVATASHAVTQPGSQPAYPQRDQLEALLARMEPAPHVAR